MCMCVCQLLQWCPALCDPMDYNPPGSVAYQAPQSMEFSRHGVGCHFLLRYLKGAAKGREAGRRGCLDQAGVLLEL